MMKKIMLIITGFWSAPLGTLHYHSLSGVVEPVYFIAIYGLATIISWLLFFTDIYVSEKEAV